MVTKQGIQASKKIQEKAIAEGVRLRATVPLTCTVDPQAISPAIRIAQYGAMVSDGDIVVNVVAEGGSWTGWAVS